MRRFLRKGLAHRTSHREQSRMSKIKRTCSNKLALAVTLASCSLAGNAALAQEPLEEIQITGSRIARPGLTSPVPVTAISNEELNFIAPGNLSQGLQQVPQFLNNAVAQNRGTFLGSAGQAFLNIRGMGTQRTLVLLNGRRVAPSDRQ